MATTTNYSWTTPDDTALVKDGAAAIRSLGSSIDTTTKALNPSTTLGDVEYRSSTANTNTRLGIGTTGQVLSVVGGVPAWTTLSSAGTPPQITSSITNWYLKGFGLAANTGQTFSDELTYYCPIILGAYTYDRLTIRTDSTHATAGQEVRLGIYNNDPATNKPSTVLLDAGRVSISSSASTNFEITISQTITTAGLYWLAFNNQVSSGAGGVYAGCAGGSVSNNNGLLNTNISTVPTSNPLIAFSQAGVSGAFATAGTLSNVIGNAKVPQVWIRKN